MLHRLYTDLHAEHWWLAWLRHTVPDQIRPQGLKRLLARRLPLELRNRLVRDFPVRTLAMRCVSGSHADITSTMLRYLRSLSWTSDDIIYSVLINADVELLAELKVRGVQVVHECMISPDVGSWIAEERKLWPGVETGDPVAEVEQGRRRDQAKYELADLILAPSEFARAGVRALGADPSKIVVVPYGLDFRRFDLKNARPQPGRVLTVGEVSLRKGTHYLSQAVQILRNRGHKFDFRVAGALSPRIEDAKAFAGPTYLGAVPRPSMAQEFMSADVFVLPTLAEGSALAHVEALAHGLPVITTPNCGAVIRDGVEGFIVPIRDPHALADRIEQIVTDRELRQQLSINAAARAREFSLEKYASRLLQAVDRLR